MSAFEAPSPLPGGYEFVRVLGRGATGWVALAHQAGTRRPVAVKVMFGGSADLDGQYRLAREGQALAALHDPRIVRVFELARAGDDLALVMEFVDGQDLSAALGEGVLGGPGRLAVLSDVAGALDVAAARQIVHRDVKPANVLVSHDGRAKLGDFGLARLSAVAAAFRTGGEVVIGTPRYMAPEQIFDPARESPAGDVYSFAVMAYEVLLGRPVFERDSVVALYHAHLFDRPVPPRQLRPAVPLAAEQALLAALAKDPADRPTAGVLAAALALDPAAWAVPTARPRVAQASGSGTAASAVASGLLGVTGSQGRIKSSGPVPWLQPSVFVPPPAPARRRVPPRVLGVLAAVLLVLVALVIVLLV